MSEHAGEVGRADVVTNKLEGVREKKEPGRTLESSLSAWKMLLWAVGKWWHCCPCPSFLETGWQEKVFPRDKVN